MTEATQLKLTGMSKSAKKHEAELLRAQLIADYLGMDGSVISSDDVRSEYEKHYGKELNIGNAMGSLFRSDKWEVVGYAPSKRAASRGHLLRTWRRKFPEKPAPQPFDVGVADGERICVACGENTEVCQCQRSN